jgi:hypothetical protein
MEIYQVEFTNPLYSDINGLFSTFEKAKKYIESESIRLKCENPPSAIKEETFYSYYSFNKDTDVVILKSIVDELLKD